MGRRESAQSRLKRSRSTKRWNLCDCELRVAIWMLNPTNGERKYDIREVAHMLAVPEDVMKGAIRKFAKSVYVS